MSKIKLDNLKVKSFLTDLNGQNAVGGCPVHTDVNCAPSADCTGRPCYESAGHPVCY
jgi:hypothetical protein